MPHPPDNNMSHLGFLASMALWHGRELQVLYSLAGCLADMKDFRLAVNIYEEILVRDADNAHFTYSTIARLFLLVSVSTGRLCEE